MVPVEDDSRVVPFKGERFRSNSNMRGEGKSEYIPLDDYKYYTTEIIKCNNDVVYFANNYFTIVTPGTGKHVINTYPRQDDLLRAMVDEDRLCVLASRQVGKTTSYNIFALHMCCFNEDKKILILANKAAAAIEFLARIKLAYELLPSWLKPGVKEYNKTSVEFANGCRIEACATTPDSARGKACDILIIDEMAFVPPNIMEELWSSVYPVVSSAKGTKVIVVSTPNGVGNMFHTTYENGEMGTDEDGWTSFKFLWDEVPGRDDEWRRKQIASFNGDMQKWNQEFGCEFLGSTNTLIPPTVLEAYKKYFIDLKKKGLDTFEVEVCDSYEVKIYTRPKDWHCYVIGCDVADGVGGDATVIKVFDVTDPLHVSEVAYFSDKYIPTISVPYILGKLGCMYNIAPIMIESNNMGRSVIDILFSIFEYSNIVQYGSKSLGIHSSNKLKTEACEHLRRYMANIINNSVILRDENLVSELKDFQKVPVGGLMNHTYKCLTQNDDHVLATVWAFYALMPEIIDTIFDARYDYIGINRYPIKLENFYSPTDVKQESEIFLSKLERTKELLASQEEHMVQRDIEEIGYLVREEDEKRRNELQSATFNPDASRTIEPKINPKSFGFF
jgi:hypothetical protein